MLQNIIEIQIQKNIFGGYGIGYYQDFTVMIEKAIKDQIVKAKIYKKSKKILFGTIEEIIKPATHQINPQCIYFDKCGGCSYQYLSYDDQLNLKLEILNEQLKNKVKIDTIIPSPIQWYYRNKTEFSFFYDENNDILKIGFHEKNYYNKIINIQECIISNKITKDILLKSINNAFLLDKNDKKNLKHLLIRTTKYGNLICLTINIEANDKIKNYIKSISSNFDVIAIKDHKNEIFYLTENEYILEQINKYKFAVNINSFLQTNTESCKILYDKIYEITDKGNTLLEMYGGVATIGIYLSDKFKKVISSDILEDNIKLASINKEINNISNIEIIHSDAENILNYISTKNLEIDTLIIDPNRAGLNKKVINNIIKINPKFIIYISCNPSTLSRDCDLLYNIGYDIIKSIAIDMFPQTYHIETIMKFKKNENIIF